MAEAAGFLDYASIMSALKRAGAAGAAEGVTRSTQQALDAIGVALTNTTAANKVLKEANTRLVQSMRTAVLHSYDQVVTAQKHVESYRTGGPGKGGDNRFGGGRLRHALEADENYVADARGIKFIDLDYMDKHAAHWYRLNFGAAPLSGRPPFSYNWEIAGVSLGRLQLAYAASLPFRLPVGFFTESGAFYPGKPSLWPDVTLATRIGRNTPTHGIAARRFLDAGLDRFSKDFSATYSNALIEWRNDGLKGLGPLANTTVKVKAIVPF